MLLLLACAPAAVDTGEATSQRCDGFSAPVLAVSETELDFGTAAEGEVVERTIEVRNDGGHPLGLSGVRIGDEQPEFSTEIGASECARAGVGIQEAPGDTPVVPGDSGPTSWEAEVPVTVLDPGCAVPVTVRFTGSRRPRVLDALVVESRSLTPEFDDAGNTLWRPDYRHRWRVVWLSGEGEGADSGDTAGEEDDSHIVGDVISATLTDVIEGEATELEVRTWGDEPSTVLWTSSASYIPFESTDQLTTTFREPRTVEGCHPGAGHSTSVYVVVNDEFGSQDWTFGKIAVWDETTALACPTEPLPCPGAGEVDSLCVDRQGCGGDCPSDDCGEGCGGCGGGSALLVGVLGLAGARRRGIVR